MASASSSKSSVSSSASSASVSARSSPSAPSSIFLFLRARLAELRRTERIQCYPLQFAPACVLARFSCVPAPSFGGVAFAGILLIGLPGRRRAWQRMLSLMLLVIAVGVVGCGGTSSSGGGGGGSSTFTVTVVDDVPTAHVGDAGFVNEANLPNGTAPLFFGLVSPSRRTTLACRCRLSAAPWATGRTERG